MSAWSEPHGGRGYAATLGAIALLLGTASLGPLFTDSSWALPVLTVIALVALTGVGLRSLRCPLALVVLAQLAVIAVLVTVLFTSSGGFGVLPGPAAVDEVRRLLAVAGTQIRDESVPVTVSPELQLLLVLLIGAAAVTVDVLVADLDAPAGAGLVLLVMVAVPASLVEELLPWWSFVLGAIGLVLLLVADGQHRAVRAGPAAGFGGLRAPAVLATVAVAVAVGLLGGSSVFGLGTTGRLVATGGGGGVGLDPFTQLRGQLDQPANVPLFAVQGLPTATYFRAVALDTYVANQGWTVSQTADDEALGGRLDPGATRGRTVSVAVTAQQYTDRWLPSPGTPTAVTGTPAALRDYRYDRTLDTLHTKRATPLPSYRVEAVIPGGSAAELRAAGSPPLSSPGAPGDRFYATAGIDPQIRRIAQTVAGSGTGTDALGAAVRLTSYFRDPANGFTYSLKTADPGAARDPLVSFLTTGKTGFCEQFASAMAAMMRSLGFASRVAVGFTAGIGDSTRRQVSTNDAHAWVEVFFSGVGWVQFDPTPLTDGRGVTPDYVTQALSPAAEGDTPTAAPTVAPTVAPAPAPTTAPPLMSPQDSTVAGGPDGGGAAAPWLRPLATSAVAVLLVVLVLSAPAAARTARRRRRWATGTAAAGWDEVLDVAADRRVELRVSETPRQTAVRLVHELGLDSAGATVLYQLVDAVEHSWYGASPTLAPSATLLAPRAPTALSRAVSEAVQRSSPASVWSRVLPPSLRRKAGASSL